MIDDYDVDVKLLAITGLVRPLTEKEVKEPPPEELIEYANLDFFISLEEDKKLFLRKYELPSGEFRFVRNTEVPIIKLIFLMMNSLWREAHQQTPLAV